MKTEFKKFTFELPGENALVTVRVHEGQTEEEAKKAFLDRLHWGRKGSALPPPKKPDNA